MAQPTQPFAYDVFVSYSSQDKTWVRGELLTRLEAAGLTVFIDFRIGAPSITEMERGVTTSRKTLLVLTPAYLASQWTAFETLMLQTLDPANRALRLIPLLKERCDLPTRIGMLTYVDFTDPTEYPYTWPRLLAALGGTATATPAPPPPATVSSVPPATGPSVTALRQLRTVLANLYPDKRSATRVAEDAGLSVTLINWDGSAVDIWQTILKEAQKQGCLDALLAVATEEYGGNRELAVAIRDMQVT